MDYTIESSANLEIHEYAKKSKNTWKILRRTYKNNMQSGDYEKARKNLKEMKDLIKEAKNEIKKVDIDSLDIAIGVMIELARSIVADLIFTFSIKYVSKPLVDIADKTLKEIDSLDKEDKEKLSKERYEDLKKSRDAMALSKQGLESLGVTKSNKEILTDTVKPTAVKSLFMILKSLLDLKKALKTDKEISPKNLDLYRNKILANLDRLEQETDNYINKMSKYYKEGTEESMSFDANKYLDELEAELDSVENNEVLTESTEEVVEESFKDLKKAGFKKSKAMLASIKAATKSLKHYIRNGKKEVKEDKRSDLEKYEDMIDEYLDIIDNYNEKVVDYLSKYPDSTPDNLADLPDEAKPAAKELLSIQQELITMSNKILSFGRSKLNKPDWAIDSDVINADGQRKRDRELDKAKEELDKMKAMLESAEILDENETDETVVTEEEEVNKEDKVSTSNNNDADDAVLDQARVAQKTIEKLVGEYKDDLREAKAAIKAKKKDDAKKYFKNASDKLGEIEDAIDALPETNVDKAKVIAHKVASIVSKVNLVHFWFKFFSADGAKLIPHVAVHAGSTAAYELTRTFKNDMKKKVNEEKLNLAAIERKLDKLVEKAAKYESEEIDIDMIIASVLYEESVNDVIDTYNLLLENTEEEEEDDTVTEGANTDIHNIKKSIKADIKSNTKLYKKSIKEHNYPIAKKAITENIKIYEKAISDVKSVKSTENSVVIGQLGYALKVGIVSTITCFIPIVGPFFSVVISLKELNRTSAEEWNRLKKEKEITPDIYNKYKTSTIANMKKLIEKNKELLKEIDKKAKEEKAKAIKEGANPLSTAKLAIYESCANGDITIEQREILINNLKTKTVVEEMAKEIEDPYVEEDVNDEYNKVRTTIYEKYANGEFDLNMREVLLEKAREKYFPVKEETSEEVSTESTNETEETTEVTESADETEVTEE